METTLISLIGKGLLGKAIGDTYDSIVKLAESNQYQSAVKRTFEELDIFANLQAIGSFVSTLSKHDLESSEPLEVVVSQIHQSISAIQEDLQAIERDSVEHRQLWFAAWRQGNCGGILKRLRAHHSQLNVRVDLLTKFLACRVVK